MLCFLPFLSLSCTQAGGDLNVVFDPTTIVGIAVGGTKPVTAITLFSTVNPHNGALGGRSGADSLCYGDREAKVGTFSSCTNVRALLSINGSDTMAAMPTNYAIPDLPLKSASNVTVANHWVDAMVGSGPVILADMNTASVVANNYWTFATASGGLHGTYTCVGGTSALGTDGGEIGAYNSTSETWLDNSTPQACSSSRYLLCICY